MSTSAINDAPVAQTVTSAEEPLSSSSAASKTSTRRRFFSMGAGAVAAMAGGAALSAQPGSLRGKPLPAPLPPGTHPDPSVTWKDPVLRLVRRISMGLEPQEVALARQMGYAGYLEYQLNADAIDDSALESAVAARMPLLSQTTLQLRTADATEVANQLSDSAMYRAAFSRRQLKERMVEFWTDHLNISLNKVGYLLVADNKTVIREHALGKFPDMLRASAESAAMLRYLDQNTSRTPTPNQNYAREIMELHTLGVDNGYTQADVAQLSRILTGWSYNTSGVFTFVNSYHDKTAKTFLETSFPAMPGTPTSAQMKAEGDAAITLLLNRPATARFISTKMARWLLAYEPPQAVIDATVAAYTATGGDIKAMIRVILTGKNLMAAPAKYKRPFHLAVSTFRGMNVEVNNIRPARQRTELMEMPSFYWEQPDGYPDRTEWWSGLVTLRWNWATYLSQQNSATNVRMNSVSTFRTPQDNADGVVNQIAIRLFGGEMPASLRAALATYLKAATYSDTRVRETVALAASSHQFQWY